MSATREHREIEPWLDAMLAAIVAGCWERVDESFRHARHLLAAHYGREEREWSASIRRGFPEMVAKMEAQHAEALEIAAALDDVLAAGGPESDRLRLARRFVAVAQHNIIEEERDLFPLAAKR